MTESSVPYITIDIFTSEKHIHATSIKINNMSMNRRFLSLYKNVREYRTGN